MGRPPRNFGNRGNRGGRSNRGHRGNSGNYYKNNHSQKFERNHHSPRHHNAPDHRPRTRKFDDTIVKVTLKENQVGITEYINPGKGFTGVVKARFSDFHVNEIDVDGKMLELKDFTVPKPINPVSITSEEKLETTKTKLSDVVTEGIWNDIKELVEGSRVEPVEFDVTNVDKEKRTAIHKVLKEVYQTKIIGTTVAKDGEQKSIRVTKANKEKIDKRANHWAFPGDYVHFLVYKENMDTSEVAAIIANSIKLKASQVNYCGTKDKRGKTTQKFCIKKRCPHQIAKSIQRIPAIKVGDFSFHEKVLKLGDLKGNRFRIALRHVDGDRAEIEKSLHSVKEKGFINYYGLQRFGNNADMPTYEVGIALLKSDYKLACELILKPRDNDIPFMKTIRSTWWKDRDSAVAASMFRNDKFIEKKLLVGLAQYGENDYANALRKIPRNMLLLYTHAYQGLIFNRIASRRIKEHGLKPIVGDLVYRNQDELDEILNLDADDALAEADPEDVEKDDGSKPEESAFKQKVKSLTEEDITSGKYTIFDVVLPLPGHDITYPANEVAQWYEEILAEKDLTSEKLKHCVKTFSLAGAYRKLLVQPQNMSWYFKKYNTPEEDVIPTHFEKANDEKHLSEGEGKYTALVLDFCLPASVYATMLLREILKSDTSPTNQAEIGRAQMKKFEKQTAEKQKEEETAKKQPIESEDEPGSIKVRDETDKNVSEKPTTEEVTESDDKTDTNADKNGAEKRPITETEEDDEPDAKKSKLETD